VHTEEAAQVVNCWQTAANPKPTLRLSPNMLGYGNSRREL